MSWAVYVSELVSCDGSRWSKATGRNEKWWTKTTLLIGALEKVKKGVPLGVVEILLEANCYNNLYAGGLASWGPEGGVHVVSENWGKSDSTDQ